MIIHRYRISRGAKSTQIERRRGGSTPALSVNIVEKKYMLSTPEHRENRRKYPKDCFLPFSQWRGSEVRKKLIFITSALNFNPRKGNIDFPDHDIHSIFRNTGIKCPTEFRRNFTDFFSIPPELNYVFPRNTEYLKIRNSGKEKPILVYFSFF